MSKDKYYAIEAYKVAELVFAEKDMLSQYAKLVHPSNQNEDERAVASATSTTLSILLSPNFKALEGLVQALVGRIADKDYADFVWGELKKMADAHNEKIAKVFGKVA